MAISPLSFSRATIYVANESAWTAVHSGYTELASDASYIEGDQDWTGSHTSYGDVYIPSEAEPEPVLPDLKAMLAVMNAPDVGGRNLEDAILTWDASSAGTLNLTLQRDSSPRDQALPQSTSSLHLSVLGTNVSAWEVFPDGSRTINLTLPGVPGGIHTLQVEAYSNGRLLGTTQLTVTIQEVPGPTPVPEQDPDSVDRIGPAEAPFEPLHSETVSPGDPHKDSRERPQGAPSPKRENATTPRLPAREELPSLKQTERIHTLDRIGEAYLGQAMAGGLGRLSPSVGHIEDRGTHESIKAIGAAREGGLEGQGSHRPPWPAAEAELDDPEGI